MSIETQMRVGKLFREGFFQKDLQAKAWAEEFFPEEVEEEKPKKRKKKYGT
jgi:hypothetical protein